MRFELNANNTKLILKESSREEYNQLKRVFNPYVNNYRFQTKFKLGIWDGKIDYFKNGFINFGLWNAIGDVCKEYGYKFQLSNKDQFPIDNEITFEKVENFCKEFYSGYTDAKGNVFFPHDHQIMSVYKLLKYKYGLIEVATSGGKSLIMATAVFYILKNINPNAKFLFILPSIMLVTQLYDDFLDYNEGYHKENQNPLELKLSEIMSDKPRKIRDGIEPNIYFGTYQSLEKYPKEFMQQFDFVAVDESHKAKAQTIIKILEKTFGYAKYRVGVSGTFPDKETSERLCIESMVGPVLYQITAKKLQDKGLISQVKIKALHLIYNDEEFAQNVNEIRKRGNGKKAYELEREYIHNSDPRLQFLTKLVTKFNNNSLVLFHSIDYGTKLYDYFRDNIKGKDFYYIDGNISAEKRDYIKKQLEITSENPKILCASYGTLSVGVSIKALTNIIFADSFKAPQLITQSIGRSLRLHNEKEKAIIFDIVDRFSKKYQNTLYKHFEKRKETVYTKQQFPLDELNITI